MSKKLGRIMACANHVSLTLMFKDCNSVLDPFIGSGTTALAANELSMDCYGFEKDLESWKICMQRINEAIEGGMPVG